MVSATIKATIKATVSDIVGVRNSGVVRVRMRMTPSSMEVLFAIVIEVWQLSAAVGRAASVVCS